MQCFVIRDLRKSRRGFTLVELLVVIAIIGVLVGLLLPSVQSAREAARRMQCSNNLKQIGLALHNYHDTNNAFPKVSYYWNGNFNGSDRQPAGFFHGFGWRTMILPFMEQNSIYDQIDFSQPINSEAGTPSNLSLIQMPIQTFLCPSDPVGTHTKSGRQYLWSNWCFPNSGCQDTPVAVTTYKGLTGAGYDQVFGSFPYPTGMFDRRRGPPLTFASMADGTTKTIAVIESSPEFNAWTGWATWHVAAHAAEAPNHARRFFGAPGGRAANQHGWTAGLSASSFHPAGVNMVLGDGSVHFLDETVNLLVYQQMVDPDDGMPTSGFEF